MRSRAIEPRQTSPSWRPSSFRARLSLNPPFLSAAQRAIHSLAFNARSTGRGSPCRISTRPRRRLTNAAGLRNTLACSRNRPQESNLRENRMGAARRKQIRASPAPKRSPGRERSGRPRAQAGGVEPPSPWWIRGKDLCVGELIPVREEMDDPHLPMQDLHHNRADHSMLLLPQVPAAGSKAYNDRGERQ